MLKIAIQKSGRLYDDSIELIKECGIDISGIKGQLINLSSNFPVQVLFLRDDDIPGYVESGVAHVGIVGENVLVEQDRKVHITRKLGFSKCRLSLALPKGFDYKGLSSFNGLSIATSYPNITQNFFKKHNIIADIHEISGSVEIAPGMGLSDAICDIVSSGSTLLTNGLTEVETVMKSEAVLIANNNLDEASNEILNKLLFRIEAVQKSKKNKYIVLNAPEHALERVKEILPGMKSPTIVPLAEKGWYGVHSVINEDEFWVKIEFLKAAGAEGILVMPIEKMIY